MTNAAIVGTVPHMSGWREKLRKAIEDSPGATMRSVSLKAKLGATFIRDALERNRTPSHENARKIETALGLQYGELFDPDWTDDGDHAVGGILEVGGSEFARLPVFDIRFAAGAGSTSDESESPIDHYLISMSLLRSATDAPVHNIAIFQADGDSMVPTINNRDWVIVDLRKTRLTNPGIYAIVFEGERFLKRAAQHLETGAVTLISDNAVYPPQTIKKPDRLTVIGRVFMSIRRH